ncbi:MAG: sugar phosphate isomerase/epimerase [Planctomycetes bacterium]|nr:sugar phosphate isomerase/epimerase [Planctomycetota bacterium]
MMEIKIGVQLASLRLPFRQALPIAARLGAQAVEIDARGEIKPQELSRTAVRQIRKMLEDLNLRVCAVRFRTRRGYGDREGLEGRVDATLQALKFAYDLGCNLVVNQVGRVPDKSEGREWELLRETLGDVGRSSQRIGALLAAETGSESGADLLRLIEALPSGSIGVTLNPGNLIIHGFSASEATRLLARHVLYVHVKDGVRDLAQGRGLEVPLGRGSVDFPEIFGLLEDQQYRGYFTVERENSQQPLVDIENSIQYLRNL